MQMYQELHKWDEAINVAEVKVKDKSLFLYVCIVVLELSFLLFDISWFGF